MVFPSDKHLRSFYTMQQTIFKYFGLLPPEEHLPPRWQMAYQLHYLQMLMFWLMLLNMFSFVHIGLHFSSLNEIVKVFFILATAISVVAKYIWIKLNSRMLVQIFGTMHSEEFMPVNRYEKKIFREALNWSRSNRNVYTCLSWTALNLLLGTQYFIDNTKLPLPIYNPLDIGRTRYYICMYIFQYISASICCITNIGFDSLASSLFIYVKGQLTILSNRLQYIGIAVPQSELDATVNLQLCDCMRFYDSILRLSHHIENIVSIPMSMQILCSVLVLIANFYAMAFLTDSGDYANLLKFAVYQLCMLTQIFILCYFANEISLESTNLSYALYSSNWPDWGKVNRKLALLMMFRFHSPIRIKTVNRCYSFNLAAFTSIVNSSYSYFALLKNMNK